MTTQSRPSHVGLKESGTTSFGVFTFVTKFKADISMIAIITAKSERKFRILPERYPELLKFFNVILIKNAPANSIMDIKKILGSKSQSSPTKFPPFCKKNERGSFTVFVRIAQRKRKMEISAHWNQLKSAQMPAPDQNFESRKWSTVINCANRQD